MTTALSQSARKSLASQVDGLLQSLAGELDASLNPHRLAMRRLGATRMGWTKVPYNEEAFAIWTGLTQRPPVETETLHHLAIMHHARAIDLEAGEDPTSADADWEAAMSFWYRLWKTDSFWDQIAVIACRNMKRDAVDALRERFPALILQVHYDIAFDPASKTHRAKYHIRRALHSSFPNEAREAVRRDTYLRFISEVPASVWQVDMLDPQVIKQGTDRIQKYLEVDPGCLPALEDTLRLQVRLLRAWYQDLQALSSDNSSERTALLRKLKEAADYWRPYLDQLVAVAEELDEEMRQKLCLWYRVMGEVHFGLGHGDQAVPFYELGIHAGDVEDDDRMRCIQGLEETHAHLAREKALAGDADAKAYCDQVNQRLQESQVAHFVLANAYVLLKEFEAAREVCHHGLNIEPDPAETDYEAIEEFSRGCEQLRKMLASVDEAEEHDVAERFLAEAREQMKAGRFANALLILNEVSAKAPHEEMTYFLRCQCHLDQSQVDEAQRDLDEFCRLADQSQATRSAAAQLQIQINELAELIGKYGNRRARVLQQEAVSAYNADRYEEAIQLLRQALDASKGPEMPEGAPALKPELAMALTAAAISGVNAAGQYAGREVYQQAKIMLEEALWLDPTNEQASENLKTLLQRMNMQW